MAAEREYLPELVIGLVAPLGVDLDSVEGELRNYLSQFHYSLNLVRLSSLIGTVDGLETEMVEAPEADRIDTHMTAGNEARKKAGRGDFIAALGVLSIKQSRKSKEPLPGVAHVFRSLKHPDEVQLLRRVYGDGFYLLGIASSRQRRLTYLTDRKGLSQSDAERLISRDESEELELGQHMRAAFHLADAFIDTDVEEWERQLGRILDLVFGKPWETPTRDEYAMFLAFAASLRSGDLSRQVGAVVASSEGEVIATGTNDVPRYGGGLYWAGDDFDDRDHVRGFDSNERQRNDIVKKIMRQVCDDEADEVELLNKGREKLRDSGIFDITEYGRAVHAEMEALLCCARSGVSPRRGTLYTSTFPCHNCAKHIIAAGLSTVVFVEPYPKSKALELHSDAIYLAHEEVWDNNRTGKVCFKPFVGIGPRRFMDLFSMTLSSGAAIERKTNGELAPWDRASARVRVPLLPFSYIDREVSVTAEIDQLMRRSYEP